MKCLLSMCLAVLTGIATFAVSGSQAPALQKGISVQMATSRHGAPMPEADNENAWIVTVTADGRIYFGTDQVTADSLFEQMKIRPRNRAARLYVKADAGAPFSSVRQVLNAARENLFDDAVLLTAQPEAVQAGTIASPKGLDVWIGNEEGSNLVTVQIGSDPGSATLKVNNEAVTAATLQRRLGQTFNNRARRIVVLKATGHVPYARVVHSIDTCRAAGASRVSLVVTPQV